MFYLTCPTLNSHKSRKMDHAIPKKEVCERGPQGLRGGALKELSQGHGKDFGCRPQAALYNTQHHYGHCVFALHLKHEHRSKYLETHVKCAHDDITFQHWNKNFIDIMLRNRQKIIKHQHPHSYNPDRDWTINEGNLLSNCRVHRRV